MRPVPDDRRRYGLAGEFFVAGIDEYTGKLQLHGPWMCLGLAAALLTEQIVDGHVRLVDGVLWAAPNQDLPSELLSRAVVEAIRQHQREAGGQPLAVWLRKLTGTVYTDVGERLVRARLAERQIVKRFWRPDMTMYVPFDPARASFHATRALNDLVNRRPLTHGELLLVTLMRATRLIDALPWIAGLDRLIVAAVPWLPPDLAYLLEQVDIAVAASTVAGRR